MAQQQLRKSAISPIRQAMFLLVNARDSALHHMMELGAEPIRDFSNPTRGRRVSWDEGDAAYKLANNAIQRLVTARVCRSGWARGVGMNLNPFTFLRKIFPGFRRDTESANKIDIPRPEKIKRGLRGLRMFRVSRLAGQVQCRCVPENGHTHFCKKHRGYVVDGRLDRATYHRLARSRAVSA